MPLLPFLTAVGLTVTDSSLFTLNPPRPALFLSDAIHLFVEPVFFFETLSCRFRHLNMGHFPFLKGRQSLNHTYQLFGVAHVT